MTDKNRKILTLSQAGGGKLTIHPDEWPALVQAVTETLQLDAEPSVALDDIPPGRSRIASPHGASAALTATLAFIPLDSPARRYKEKSGA